MNACFFHALLLSWQSGHFIKKLQAAKLAAINKPPFNACDHVNDRVTMKDQAYAFPEF